MNIPEIKTDSLTEVFIDLAKLVVDDAFNQMGKLNPHLDTHEYTIEDLGLDGNIPEVLIPYAKKYVNEKIEHAKQRKASYDSNTK